jgi:hypothetical protein
VPPRWPGQAQRAARPGRRPPELELTSVGLESVGPAGAACPRRTFADLAPTSVGPLRVVGRTSPRRSDLSASVGPFVGRTFRDLRDVLSRTWRQRRSDLSSVGPFDVGRTFRTWRQRRSDLSGPFADLAPTSVGPIGRTYRTYQRRSDLSSVGPFVGRTFRTFRPNIDRSCLVGSAQLARRRSDLIGAQPVDARRGRGW